MNIIINGPGRSGTTLLSRLLSYHKDLGWISGWVNRFPHLPILSVFNFAYRLNIFGVLFYKTPKSPRPAEAYGFWNYYIESFNDVYIPTENEIKKTKRTINLILKFQKQKYLITKITGGARLNILNKIFSNYTIIWIERDPRVIVSSYIKQKWFYKDKIEDFNKLTNEQKITFYCNYYLKIYHKSKDLDCKIIFYEDLCKKPLQIIENILVENNLKLTDAHKSFISNYNISEINWENYKEKFNEKEIELMKKLLIEPLKDYKYL